MWGYYGGGMWGGGWLMMILFWGVIVWLIVLAVRGTAGGQGRTGKTPMDILDERYAKGEIDKKEFEEKKKDLS